MSPPAPEPERCEVCGSFDGVAFDGCCLCPDCYHGRASCCAEGPGREADDAAAADDDAATSRS